jgi:hypothetical protein
MIPRATVKTEASLAETVQMEIDKISPEKDVLKVKANIPRSLALAIPDPILYEHGQVGSCNDLIFGFSLVDYATSKGLQDGQIPKIVKLCIEAIDTRGLKSEGIYRVSGRHAVVQAVCFPSSPSVIELIKLPSVPTRPREGRGGVRIHGQR